MVIKKESIGERGKTAQDLTQKHLDLLNTKHASFTYIRLQDARAAGGRLKKQLADFICWYHKKVNPHPHDYLVECLSMPLEVKSTEHDYRITKDHLSQLPMLKKVKLAGAEPYVLVLFKQIEKWRIAPIDFFPFGQASWDMSKLPMFDTAQDALESTGFFPVL
jgi:hypothetical protein